MYLIFLMLFFKGDISLLNTPKGSSGRTEQRLSAIPDALENTIFLKSLFVVAIYKSN